MKKKILFVQPTIRDDHGTLIKKRRLFFVGLAYPLLAALTPPDWEVDICLETIEEIPWETDAAVVGVGGMGHGASRGTQIAAEFRRRGKTVIMGGPMASLAPELVRDFCDAVVIGDADAAWPEVIRDLERGTLQSSYRRELATLSSPVPRYELILGKRIGDFLPVQAGRGCPNSCSFCSVACLYRTRYLRRPIPEVVRDIRRVRELGFRKFLLLDDNIVADRGYLLELCGAIRPLGMTWLSQCAITVARDPELLAALAGCGCTLLSFGLESLSRETLVALNKGWSDPGEYDLLLRRVDAAGIDIATEMIVGADADTRASLLATAAWVARTPIAAPKFYILTPIPGTELYGSLRAQGRIVGEDVFTFSPSRAVIAHPAMSTDELDALFWEIYDRLYTVRRILMRTVLRRRFLRSPGRCLFLLAVNLFYRHQIRRRIAPIVM